MNATAQKLLAQPDVQIQIRHLQTALQDETQRRHAFREMITEDMKAEFINGEVIIHSPVKRRHLDASEYLTNLLKPFVTLRQIGKVWVEKAMVALTRNDYEPDICFYTKGRLDAFGPDHLLFPAPDLAVEILCKKTAKTAKTIKKSDYAAHGVREYWIVDPKKQTIEQNFLLAETDEEYFFSIVHHLGDDIESKVIPGFVIPVAAVFDEKENLAALEHLLRKAVE